MGGYNALTEYFPTYTMKPNPGCDNKHCIKSAEEYKQYLIENPIVEEEKQTNQFETSPEDLALFAESGIELVEANDNEVSDNNNNNNKELEEKGIKFEYSNNKNIVDDKNTVKVDESDNLNDLLSTLNNL